MQCGEVLHVLIVPGLALISLINIHRRFLKIIFLNSIGDFCLIS